MDSTEMKKQNQRYFLGNLTYVKFYVLWVIALWIKMLVKT